MFRHKPKIRTEKSQVFVANFLNVFFFFTHQTQTRQAIYYDVTLRRVRVTIVAVEKQQVLHILSVSVVFNYRARNTRALYYIIMCVLSGCTIFFHIIP